MSETRTDWHDAARIAIVTGVDIQRVRYHWRRAWRDLDLPPLATGFIDHDRAKALIKYIQDKRYKCRTRRSDSTAR